MVMISVLNMLLLFGAISASDLAWLFFSEVSFCGIFLLFFGLVREINHCMRMPRPEILQPIVTEEIF